MKRNVKRSITPITLSLFSEQVEVLKRMPNASFFVREELDKVLSKPLTELQIAALNYLYNKVPTTEPFNLMTMAKDNGISVSTMQCREFLLYHVKEDKNGSDQ